MVLKIVPTQSKMSKNTNVPQEVNWVARIAILSGITTFDDLVTYVNNNPLSPFTDEPNDIIT